MMEDDSAMDYLQSLSSILAAMCRLEIASNLLLGQAVICQALVTLLKRYSRRRCRHRCNRKVKRKKF